MILGKRLPIPDSLDPRIGESYGKIWHLHQLQERQHLRPLHEGQSGYPEQEQQDLRHEGV